MRKEGLNLTGKWEMMTGRKVGVTTVAVSSAARGIVGQQMLKKGPWTVSEDAILMDYVKMHGEGKWNLVQKNSGLQRSGKSIRLRWLNHLHPDLRKGPFAPEEEMLIFQLHALHGNKWSRIASQVPGRTDNEIKNFWNTKKKREKRAVKNRFCSLDFQQLMELRKFSQGGSSDSRTATSTPVPATPTQMEGNPPLLYAAEPTPISLFNSAPSSPAESAVGLLSQNSFRSLLKGPGPILQENMGAEDFLPDPLAAVSAPTPAVASQYVLGSFELSTTPLPIISPSCSAEMELPSSQVSSEFDEGEHNPTPMQDNNVFFDALLHASQDYGVGKLLKDDQAMETSCKLSDIDSSIGTQLNKVITEAAPPDTSTLFYVMPAYAAEWYNDIRMAQAELEFGVGFCSSATCISSVEPLFAPAAYLS
ncbi:hypothetical protein HPP92_017591 [Vanilla planifolia]|uniref:Uncharacterized protein n=1 Tax=Vanilla planifolia TaxID=51239 RepID=A0A835UT96_VANPL|nr:hypothetical protein HPP92_017591 [Vanilla planifolia]